MSTVDDRITVASLLAAKLPGEIVALAKPLDERCPLSLTLSLEPWIEIPEPGQKVEVHIKEGGNVKLRVTVAGRTSKPRESSFACKDGNYQAFTDYLARNFDTLVDALSQGRDGHGIKV